MTIQSIKYHGLFLYNIDLFNFSPERKKRRKARKYAMFCGVSRLYFRAAMIYTENLSVIRKVFKRLSVNSSELCRCNMHCLSKSSVKI